MKLAKSTVSPCLLLCGCAMVCNAAVAVEIAAKQPHVSFNRDIRPILVKHCFECHGADEKAREAELRLDQRSVATSKLESGEIAIVPSRPDESALVTRIFSDDADEIMPPAETKKTLSEHEKNLLRRWIAEGAEYKQHWAFVRPIQHTPPTAKNRERVKNEIDQFVIKSLEDRSLSLAPEADRRTLIRRLSFGLTGLPPTSSEVEEFVSNESPAAYEKLVDRLLASPRYGERWARHWLDLARYADSAGYEGDPEYYYSWRYRDYVIDALNNDKPYDEFIKEQLAGDELVQITGAGEPPLPKPEHVVALTFLRLAPFTEPRGDESRHELLSEMTGTTGAVFLGLTVGCAKCHNHKYDQIPIKDFYRMKAFFATVQIAPPVRGDAAQIGGPQPADFYRPGEKEWAKQLRAAHEARMQDIDKVPEKQRSPELKAEKTRLQLELKRLAPLAMSLRHTFGPPYEPGSPVSHVLDRGQWDRKLEVVEPGFLSAITGDQRPAEITLDPFKRWPTRGWRKTLAEWIASGENPLTARVMVNRLWQHHFGRGIVATSSDFGTLGSPPTHPELLDWLALRFVEKKWSLKQMHRLMVTSATYRQSSQHRDAQAEMLDPKNDLLWRFRRTRLEAEAIRDSVLAASGRLNTDRVGGLPFFPALPTELAAVPQNYHKGRWQPVNGPASRRRSIYIFQQRSGNVPLLDTFDAHVPDTTCSRRRTSVTALQSLAMYNGEFVNTEANHLAERVRSEVGDDMHAHIRRAFKLVLARTPGDDELKTTVDFFALAKDDQPLLGLCRVLLNSNEFLYID